ncbi:hypothetical protein FRC10_011234 [Ceratobasidium sp. 414]|nr:hypothetical protein FRC10_011234 [Ceratobasidium sp. 414]
MKPRDFEIRLAGRQADNPVDGLLGIDQCTWPVRAEIVPLKGALELKKVEIEVVVYEYGEIRIKSSAQTSRDLNVEKILYHGRVVVFDAGKDSKSRAACTKITQPLSISHCFEIPTTLPGAIRCHKDPASVVWKLNISPHVLQGRDDRRGVAWAIEFPRSFFAAGECLSGKLTLRRFSAKSKFTIRALNFELTEHVITRASAIPSYGDVQEYRGCRSLIKSKVSVEQPFGNDNTLAVDLPITKSKHGLEFEHLTQFPLRIVAVAFEERVRLTAGKKLSEQPAAQVADVLDPAPAYVEKLMGAYDPPPPFPVR